MSDHIRVAYDHLTRARNCLLASNQERCFGKSPETVSAVLTDCEGYVTAGGIAVLEIGEALPHNKELQSSTLNDHWLGCIHAAIGKIAEYTTAPCFDMALVGFRLAMPRGANNARMWDASNRALNLVINNLKGVFFPDDNIEHMAFAVLGCWAEAPKTTVYIGDYHTQREEIIRLLDTQKTPDLIPNVSQTGAIHRGLGEWISGIQQV